MTLCFITPLAPCMLCREEQLLADWTHSDNDPVHPEIQHEPCGYTLRWKRPVRKVYMPGSPS